MKRAFPLGRALLGAAIIVVASAALKGAAPDYLSPEWVRRLTGVLLGFVVVYHANVIPKSLARLTQLRCAPAVEQAARRFAGWSLVLGGLGYMLAMLLAPLAHMHLIGGTLLAVALAAALLRCFGARSTAA